MKPKELTDRFWSLFENDRLEELPELDAGGAASVLRRDVSQQASAQAQRRKRTVTSPRDCESKRLLLARGTPARRSFFPRFEGC